MQFEVVYEEHFRFVWRALRRLGVREADVADAVQDVFIVVHRKLDEFEGRAKLTTWLYGICFRVAHDRRRLAEARRARTDDTELDDHPDERVDVAGEIERRQGLAMLEAILDELPLEQRAVFTLFELDGMKGEEIAEMLEIPIGTAHSRLRLARHSFRDAITRMQARDRFKLAAGGKR